jgi:4-diphosphocytidyl-2-C-methyl-D-erythritol kinase
MLSLISEFAPAKINLGLAVTGRLGNGFHALDTLFCTLDVGDTLTLEPTDSGIELAVVGADLPVTSDNLVFRAAQVFLEAASIKSGVRLVLTKRLPIAAGLGGGSSDAAACLRGLQRLFGVDLDLFGLAKSLGADVPFLLRGGAARASGIGEILEPVVVPPIYVVLANPRVGITAKEAYLGLNGRFGGVLDVLGILNALSRGDAPLFRNDLEVPVLEVYPVVQQVKDVLSRAGLFGVLMSGSGSTCFGLARSQEEAARVALDLQLEQPDWWVCAATNYFSSSST